MIQQRLIFIALFLFAFYSNSQAQGGVGAELLAPFKAKLAESRKQISTPILPELDTSAGKKLKYDVPERIIGITYPDPNIRPVAMSAGKLPESYGFYAKAGIGYPLSPIGELSFHNKVQKDFKFGGNFFHHSGQGNVDNQVFGNTRADLGGTYFMKNGLAAGARFGFNLDAYRFYGHNKLSEILPDSLDIFPDSIAVPKDSVSQRFFEFFGNVHLFNAKVSKLDLNYKADINFHSISDKYGASEFVFAPEFAVEKWLKAGQYKHRFGADLLFNMASFNNDSTGKARNLINFRPAIDLNFGAFKSTIATNLGSSEGQFFVLPDLRLQLTLANGMFNAYGGWTGAMRTNTFRSLTQYNPFVSSSMELRHTKYSEFFGGLMGNVKGIGYDFRAGYANNKNLPVFLNDSTQDYLRFNVLYDTVSVINFKGSLNFQMIKNLSIMAAVGYNIYTNGSMAKAYHLPTFESNFTLLYQVKALVLKAELFVNAGTPYIDILTGNNKALGGLMDLNFGATYWVGKDKQNFGFFADINNVLNNKAQRWYLYPQIGFNARAGFVAKF